MINLVSTKLKKSLFVGVPALALICLVAGCKNPSAAQIKTFSEACIVTVSNTSSALQLAQDDYIRRQVSEQALKFGTDDYNVTAVEPFYKPEQLQVRFEVLQGLVTYASTLSTLVGNAALTNLDINTAKLGQNLNGLDATLIKNSFFDKTTITPEELQIFTTAVNALGHWLISYKQHKAAKEAIMTMQYSITNICVLLQKDFDTLQSEIDSDNLVNLEKVDTFMRHNIAAFTNNPATLRPAVENAVSLYREKKTKHDLMEAMKGSVKKLAATHTALADVFSKDSTNITAMIQDFSAEASRVSSYYNSLKTNK